MASSAALSTHTQYTRESLKRFCRVNPRPEPGSSTPSSAMRLSVDLFQDFGHGNGRGHAASGSFSGFGAVRSKNASILPAGVW